MLSLILKGLSWLLGAIFARPSQEAQQAAKAAAATAQAQGATNVVIELKQAAAARDAAARLSLRVQGTGGVTLDPDAPINSTDAEDRRD
jgi:hypothetical protein